MDSGPQSDPAVNRSAPRAGKVLPRGRPAPAWFRSRSDQYGLHQGLSAQLDSYHRDSAQLVKLSDSLGF